MVQRPGGELARRPLHFIWIADCSGSMGADGKIQALNSAIRECIPHMREAAHDNPTAQVLVRALRFSSGAQWHVATPTLVDSFTWTDLTADGETFMGKALEMVADQLKIPPMTDRALPPVLVLISDGQPTDDFNKGLRLLNEQNWGKKAVRISIAIGRDADMEVLQKFVGENNERRPLVADNAEQLVNYIKWASTAVLGAAANPPSQQVQGEPDAGSHVPIPVVPPLPTDANATTGAGATTPPADIW